MREWSPRLALHGLVLRKYPSFVLKVDCMGMDRTKQPHPYRSQSTARILPVVRLQIQARHQGYQQRHPKPVCSWWSLHLSPYGTQGLQSFNSGRTDRAQYQQMTELANRFCIWDLAACGHTRKQNFPSARFYSSASGSVNKNVLPWFSSLSTRMLPPWASTMCLAMARPSPVPPESLERPLSTR